MYDDGHVYTDTAGSIKWKFAGGPAAEYAAATGYNPYKLSQHKHKKHHHRDRKDTFDSDPTSTSMYDDTHKLGVPAGSLKNGPEEVPKKEATPPVDGLMHKKHHHKHLR
jgi:hypothetical protein